MRAGFCVKFYTTVEQENIHFIAKFGWNISENGKSVLYFNQDNPYFSSYRA